MLLTMKPPTSCFILVWTGCLLYLSPIFGQGKLSLSVQLAPHYTFTKTNFVSEIPVYSSGSPVPTITSVDVNLKQTGQGYSVGLIARYTATERFSFSTGVVMNRTSYKVPVIVTNPDLSADPNGVQFEGIATTKRNYQVPLLINYQSSIKRLSPYFSAGATVSFPYSTIFSDGSTGKIPNQRVVDIYPILGAGVTYQLSDHLSLIAQPTFTYILPSGKFISYKNYKLDLQTQILYTF